MYKLWILNKDITFFFIKKKKKKKNSKIFKIKIIKIVLLFTIKKFINVQN